MAFQPFLDGENASQLAFMARSRSIGPLSAPVGKRFQAGTQQSDVTPIARRPLSDVNSVQASRLKPSAIPGGFKSDLTAITNQKSGCLNVQKVPSSVLKPPMPASKPPSGKHASKPKSETVTGVTARCESLVAIQTKAPSPSVADIEFMDLHEDSDDDFEDLWPKSDRPDAFLPELLNWRPTSIFPYVSDSESEDELLLDSTCEGLSIIEDVRVEVPEIVAESEEEVEELLLLPH